jgi:hypothetical protein
MTRNDASERLATMLTKWAEEEELHPGEVIGALLAIIETMIRETCSDEVEIQGTIDAACYALKSYSARQKREAA